MKRSIILLLCFISIAALAQTKKIAFKSHSGSAENFSLALENELFDMENSNFGVAPSYEIQQARLDSVIFVCDTLALMVTSQQCMRVLRHSQQPLENPRIWKPGKAEVINHPLFSKQHSLDSIKEVIRTQYNFQNPIEKVVFIGYDNNIPVTEKKKKPDHVRGMVLPADIGNTPGRGTGGLIVAGILLASLLGGVLSWQYYRFQEQKERKVALLAA